MSTNSCGGDSGCSACGDQSSCSPEDKEAQAQAILEKRMGAIKHKFMVISGKGGVGKSSVTVNLAASLAKKGFKVGIVDADIHGPNIPKMLGVEGRKPEAVTDGILPIAVTDNLCVMSIAFFLQETSDAIVWRGPMKHGLLKQFYGDVNWGSLDFLIIDLPPGTGDEALSTAHLLKNVDGAINITTPQEVALLDCRKSITFCNQLNIPLISVVENMSGMACPHCNETIELFKTGGGERLAAELKLPFLGRIPLDPEMVLCSDDGKPFVETHPDSRVTEAFAAIAEVWAQKLCKNC